MKPLGLNQARVLLALEAAPAFMTRGQIRRTIPQLANSDVVERTLDSLAVRGLVDTFETLTRGEIWGLARQASDSNRIEALEQAREIVAQADA